MTFAIVGRPNVGKSSLFTRLVERERAIVTATPGTTRDLVSETVAIGGIPVRLVDTAGIRAATDEAESIGIQKSYEALAEADLVLVVLDASNLHPEEDAALQSRLENRPAIFVQNKSDLVKAPHVNKTPPAAPAAGNPAQLRTSALTGEGIAELREAILKQTAGDPGAQHESGMLTNVPTQGSVRDSPAALDAAVAAGRHSLPHQTLPLAR